MRTVLILGAGFGGLELASRLSDLHDELRVVLIDRNASFTFGFSKLDIVFRGKSPEDVRLEYRELNKPGVEFRQETVLSIDRATRQVVTDHHEYLPDYLVVALGAEYEPEATPGFVEDGYEYYSIEGARRLRGRLETFEGGTIVIAVLSVPFKCPPAPYEGALLLHESLVRKGVRDRTHIHVVTPMPAPIPVSEATSTALVAALAERGIEYSPSRRVTAIDKQTHVATTKAGDLPYDIFIGIPKHRVPRVVAESGLTEGGNDGWIKVDRDTLRTPYPGIFAIGDCADAPVPRAGVFAENAAQTLADVIAAEMTGGPPPERFKGRGGCFIEFGDGLVGKVDADFLSGPVPVAPLVGPSAEIAQEKTEFAPTRRRRWFTG